MAQTSTESEQITQNMSASTSPGTENSEVCSASRSKLKRRNISNSSSDDSESEADQSSEGYRLVNMKEFASVLKKTHVCEGHLMVSENSSSRYGLMSDLTMECSSCSESTVFGTSPSVTERGQSFDVNNRRAVYHSLETGGSYEGLVTFCSIMNMPCLSEPAYYQQVNVILMSLEAEPKEEMQLAGQRLWEMIVKEQGEEGTDDPVDVAVSFVGTWAKRDFTSITGVVFVISVDTGEVLDYHVLSKECRKCSMKRSKCKSNEEFEEWLIEHQVSNQCDINFSGSSLAMEAEGATVLWKRSIEYHNLRYRWMVSDGDSKAHSAVEDTYDDCKVEKLDCVGHVQIRMGKHLMNLKSATKGKLADGKTIGGKCRLSESRIKCIQRYYGLAIRQNTIKKPNPTAQEVKVAVYTIKKHHCYSASFYLL